MWVSVLYLSTYPQAHYKYAIHYSYLHNHIRPPLGGGGFVKPPPLEGSGYHPP